MYFKYLGARNGLSMIVIIVRSADYWTDNIRGNLFEQGFWLLPE
jgi:hypothetical protein